MDSFADRYRPTQRRPSVRRPNHLAEREVRELRTIVFEYDERERPDTKASRN